MWVLTSHTERGRAHSREHAADQKPPSLPLLVVGLTMSLGPKIYSPVLPVSERQDGVWEFVSCIGPWIITILIIQWAQ